MSVLCLKHAEVINFRNNALSICVDLNNYHGYSEFTLPTPCLNLLLPLFLNPPHPSRLRC